MRLPAVAVPDPTVTLGGGGGVTVSVPLVASRLLPAKNRKLYEPGVVGAVNVSVAPVRPVVGAIVESLRYFHATYTPSAAVVNSRATQSVVLPGPVATVTEIGLPPATVVAPREIVAGLRTVIVAVVVTVPAGPVAVIVYVVVVKGVTVTPP